MSEKFIKVGYKSVYELLEECVKRDLDPEKTEIRTEMEYGEETVVMAWKEEDAKIKLPSEKFEV